MMMFILGMIFGGSLGIFIMGLLTAAKMSDEKFKEK